jgi:hypothetical protein
VSGANFERGDSWWCKFSRVFCFRDQAARAIGVFTVACLAAVSVQACGSSSHGVAPSSDASADDVVLESDGRTSNADGLTSNGDASGEAGASCPPVQPPDVATRLAALEASIQQGFPGTSGWATYTCTSSSGGPTVRDMLWKAIAELDLPSGSGGNVADAVALVERAMQSLQPTGFFPWQLCNTSLGPDDANSLEFTSMALGILLRAHSAQLPTTTVASITAQVPSILSALKCDVTTGCGGNPRGSALVDSYTNVWLANAAAQVILSGVAGLDAADAGLSTSALDQGTSEFASYDQLVQTEGIVEYDSPTYYGADLEALESAYAFGDDQHRSTIQQALDWMWRDIAANYFPSRESLSGPHSRNYNFVESYGGVDWFTYMLGWRADVPQTVAEPNVERAILLELSQQPNAYVPAADVVAAASECTKLVTSRWGNSSAGATRYNRVTPAYALGSVSGGFGAQDEQFVAEVGDHNLPVISVIVDDTDDPYGTKTVKTGLFSKPIHLVPRPLGIQKNGTLFGLLEITPSLTSTSLATNIVFPLQAQAVLLDKAPIAASTQTVAASANSVLGVRDHGGCIAARILLADSYGSTAAEFELVVDAEGLAVNAGRLVAYHAPPSADAGPVACGTTWTSGSAPLACRPRAAVVIAGAACSSDSDLSQLMSTVASGTLTSSDSSATTWTASLSLGGSIYAGARDRTHGQILTQTVDATMPATFAAPLCVDGLDPTGTACN